MIRKTLLAISLVLLVGTVGLWVRSYWIPASLGYNNTIHAVSASVTVRGGHVWVQVLQWDPNALARSTQGVDRMWGARLSRLPQGFHWASVIWAMDSKTQRSKLMWWRERGPYSRTAIRVHGAIVAGMCLAALLFIIGGGRVAARIFRRRHNLCLKCGYDLTGNVSGRCSECGTPVEGAATS